MSQVQRLTVYISSYLQFTSSSVLDTVQNAVERLYPGRSFHIGMSGGSGSGDSTVYTIEVQTFTTTVDMVPGLRSADYLSPGTGDLSLANEIATRLGFQPGYYTTYAMIEIE